jgi:membrane-anchored protein YejM (alkaline phosphatase superfamily)
MAQVAEGLRSKHKYLCSNPSTRKKKIPLTFISWLACDLVLELLVLELLGRTLICQFLCKHVLSPLCIYLSVKILGQYGSCAYDLWRNCFPPFQILTSNVWDLQFLHIIASIVIFSLL